jgi:asparagine synthase (glutamine-hydrolysing)
MCGICGVMAVEGLLAPALAQAIRPMTARLHHRGPDGAGHTTHPHAALGHARLAIIDRAGGSQPMSDGHGRWIVFNGEIYNHYALRKELVARGYVFKTMSDTEVILHAYAEYGKASVERLHGMFAFAIYDSTKAELFIARDRLGKKPLFYAVLGGALHFASEMKALYESPAWDGTLDPSTLEGYLALGYILAPRTVYKHVRKLEPGYWLSLRDGRITTARYWDVARFDDHSATSRELGEELDTLLRQVVTERLESEVPLGAFLSGGIDSGLVVSYMAEAMNQPVRTTSVGFGSRGHNELSAAALTAAHWKTDQVSEVVDPRLDQVLDHVVQSFDEPFADSSAIPTYYVSAIARRQVTVALSGDGGDEAFGGYSFRYVPHGIECMVREMLPGKPGYWAMRQLASVWPRSARLPRALRWGTLFDNLSDVAACAYFSDLCAVKPAVVRKLLGQAPADMRALDVFEAVTAPYRRCASPSAVQCAEYADLKIYLPNDVLVKVDRMSMAHALEVRCPLLDHRVIELAFRIPQSEKMPWLRPKHLLRSLAQTRLPKALLNLPKRGFSAPVDSWVAAQYRIQFVDEVFGPGSFVRGMLDVPTVRRMLDEQTRRQANHAYALWSVWMLERWSRLNKRGLSGAQERTDAA